MRVKSWLTQVSWPACPYILLGSTEVERGLTSLRELSAKLSYGYLSLPEQFAQKNSKKTAQKSENVTTKYVVRNCIF